MKAINAKKAPAAVGPYVHAIQAGNTIYASGQLGLIPETGELAVGVEAQAEQAFANVKEVLREAGCTLNNVVKTTVFLADMKDFAAFNAVYEKYFVSKPARSCVAAAALPKAALVEVELIAIH